MRRWLQEEFLTMQFSLSLLTRIPIRTSMPAGRVRQQYKNNGRYFPFVGMIFVLLQSMFMVIIMNQPLSELQMIWLCLFLLGLEILYTGAMHIDGFCDCIEGLVAGKNPQQAFTIMRDSNTGVYANLALFFLLFSKILLMYGCFQTLTVTQTLIVFAHSEVLSRTFLLVPLRTQRIDKGSHLAKLVGYVTKYDLWFAMLTSVVFLWIVVVLFSQSNDLKNPLLYRFWIYHVCGIFCFGLVTFVFSRTIKYYLQAINGDCLGMLQQCLWLTGFALAVLLLV